MQVKLLLSMKIPGQLLGLRDHNLLKSRAMIITVKEATTTSMLETVR